MQDSLWATRHRFWIIRYCFPWSLSFSQIWRHSHFTNLIVRFQILIEHLVIVYCCTLLESAISKSLLTLILQMGCRAISDRTLPLRLNVEDARLKRHFKVVKQILWMFWQFTIYLAIILQILICQVLWVLILSLRFLLFWSLRLCILQIVPDRGNSRFYVVHGIATRVIFLIILCKRRTPS